MADEIRAVIGPMYDRPQIIEGLTFPEPEFSAYVGGVPEWSMGKVVTRITKDRSGAGISGFYDRILVWSGDEMIAEVPAWTVAIYYGLEEPDHG